MELGQSAADPIENAYLITKLRGLFLLVLQQITDHTSSIARNEIAHLWVAFPTCGLERNDHCLR